MNFYKINVTNHQKGFLEGIVLGSCCLQLQGTSGLTTFYKFSDKGYCKLTLGGIKLEEEEMEAKRKLWE